MVGRGRDCKIKRKSGQIKRVWPAPRTLGAKRGKARFWGKFRGCFKNRWGGAVTRRPIPWPWPRDHAPFDLSRAFQPFSAVMILGAIAAVIKRMADTF